MRQIVVTVPGKIHFLGEHAVVYGKPALITAINSRVKIIFTAPVSQKHNHQTAQSRQRNKLNIKNNIVLRDTTLKIKEELTIEAIYKLTKKARSSWKKFRQTGWVKFLKEIVIDPLDLVKIAIGETLLYYKINYFDSGFSLTIESEIPIGAGLGSSSSTASAVVGVVTLFLNKPFDKKIINEIVYKVEQRIHGNPSGGDNTAVIYGGFIWFQKETETKKLIRPLNLKIPKKFSANFLLIDTGKPQESTGEMVAGVKKLFEENPKARQKFLTNQEILVKKLGEAIKNGMEKELIRIIREGERNLEEIGVVSSYVTGIIREVESLGGAGKICGGGGKTKGTGILLCYHREKAILKDLALKHRLKSMEVKLGGEGIKIEKGNK